MICAHAFTEYMLKRNINILLLLLLPGYHIFPPTISPSKVKREKKEVILIPEIFLRLVV